MLIDKLIKEVTKIDNELKNDNVWINYHFKIQYNELDKKLLIIVVDDDVNENDIFYVFRNISNKDIIILLMMYINNYDVNKNYHDNKHIFDNIIFDCFNSVIIS